MYQISTTIRENQ